MEHHAIPTVLVAADTASGYRIINASDHDPALHEPWPPVEPATPAPTVIAAEPPAPDAPDPAPPEPKRSSNKKA